MNKPQQSPPPGPDYYLWEYFTDHSLTPDDYLYGNQGPWPQPAPDHPLGQLAQVLHVPAAEQAEWKSKVARKYLWLLLTRWPFALYYALSRRHYRYIDDARFSDYLREALYSKFLSPLDSQDREIFSAQIADLDVDTCCMKSDFSCMEVMAPEDVYPGMYAAPSVTLLTRATPDSELHARAIHLPREGRLLTPGDADAWQLAKYFVLQGAAHRINLIDHAVVHFPFDPINAITKTLLPKQHWLQQLLLPHCRLSLPVNFSVLEGAGSLINRTKWVIYSPFVAAGDVVRRLLPWGYVGQPGNSSYPAYRFPVQPGYPPSDYGRFLRAYRDTIRRFVADVVERVNALSLDGSRDPLLVSAWADQCAQWVPGFPDGEAIQDDEILIETLTTIIWDISVAHATDHDTLYQMPTDELIFRLRLPPPGAGASTDFDPARLCGWFDLFKSWLTNKLFYQPHNVAWLKDTDYGFEDPQLRALNERLLQDLRETERQLERDGVRLFAKLENMAASIQY